MRHTKDELAQYVAERYCWEVARRDDTGIARRLYRKQEVDGIYPWMKGRCCMIFSTSWTRSV
jgi:hypothetical protein